MKEISCKEVKEKLEREDIFKLVNCLSREKYELMHIPGSVNFPITPDLVRDITSLKLELSKFFSPQDEIVLYCTDNNCQASILVYNQLEEMGYEKLSRFSGGLKEWESDGYPFEGSRVEG